MEKVVVDSFLFVEEPIEEIEIETIIKADYKRMCNDVDYRQEKYSQIKQKVIKKYQKKYTILDFDVSEFYLLND